LSALRHRVHRLDRGPRGRLDRRQCGRPGGDDPRGDCELARLAGLQPAAVLCELMNEDGSMMRGDELLAFSRRRSIPMLTIEELVAHLREGESALA
jgi:hypothetical protein